MRVSELRIGNWVSMHDEPEKIQFGSEIDEASNWLPIPLTEEWLVKAGFERMVDGLALKLPSDPNYHSDSYSLYFDWSLNRSFTCGTKENAGMTLPAIKHVHQLQNLYFALTGEELTIKNQR